MSQAKSLVVSNKLPKSDKYFPDYIVKKLYETVDSVRDRFYIKWHIETGVRISDIVGQKHKGKDRVLGQEIQNIDFERCCIKTWDFKKDSWRDVYFPVTLKWDLKVWLKERQNLGLKGRELFPYSEKTCNRILKKWCKEIGFKYYKQVGTHWCRHTFIRLSRKSGRDIKAVQQNTGDTIETLLNWYSDLSSEDMRHEIDGKPIVI